MTVAAVSFRTLVRAFNTLGHALERVGLPVVDFDRESIVGEARARAGLHDFGGDEFHEPLRRLLEGYRTEARFTAVGRLAARRDTVSLLANRLRLVEDRRRHPAIADEAIRRPLFIVGLPRTGSTLLHHLLAQDPASRVLQAWEVMFPSPPPERSRYETDPRIRRAERQLRWLDRMAPEFKAIHPLGARLALECIALMSYSFLSSRFHTTYHVPSYQEWLEQQDLRPAYELHRRALQHLQWRAPAERWILKAPSHLYGLDALFETYPDAVVVQTHREPLVVLASVASLTAVLQGAFTDRLDLGEIGHEVTRRWANGLERAVHLRQSGRVPGDRFLDVHYHDLLADPITVIRGIYARFDVPFTEEAERRMRRHLAGNPQGKNGMHRYSLATFGLDPEELTHRFKAYREHFGIRAERA
ncbi:MAG: sulfotransferase [Candidatus Rokuibacteriota bacterium]